jgi:hypothetical protein
MGHETVNQWAQGTRQLRVFHAHDKYGSQTLVIFSQMADHQSLFLGMYTVADQ